MNTNRGFIKKCGELLALGVIAGVLIAGCGGGGGGGSTTTTSGGGGGTTTTSGTSAAGTAVANYIADMQGTGSIGLWDNQFLLTFMGLSASAVSGATTLATTSTANVYSSTYTEKLLVNGNWGANATPVYTSALYELNPSYDLIPSGWFLSPSTGALTDSGDGINFTLVPTGEPSFGLAVAQWSLAGTAIVCTSPTTGAVVTCAVPGNYPAGARLYSPLTYGTTRYWLDSGTAVTDQNGTPLIDLPVIGTTTFCDPNTFPNVFQPASAGSSTYNVYAAGSCTGAGIASGIAGGALMTAVLSTQATGNSVVPSVLIASGANTGTNASAAYIYGVRAGNVWAGMMKPSGSKFDGGMNKIAINAELVANGLATLP